MTPRLKEHYHKTLKPELVKQFGGFGFTGKCVKISLNLGQIVQTFGQTA